jgi:leucyl aminopeptidase
VPPPAGWRAAAAFDSRATGVALLNEAEGPTIFAAMPQAGTRLEWERLGGAIVAAAPPEAERLDVHARSLPSGAIVGLAVGASLRAWRFDRHRGKRGEQDARPGGRLAALDLLVDDPSAMRAALERATAATRGCLFARELTAEPANELTPKAFAARLEGLAEHGVAVDVLSRRRLARLGANALMAVGAGSSHGPRLAILRWRGSYAAAPLAFVGKGICFDSGGLSLKQAEGMASMRADMAGAAACAGAILSLALRQSPTPAVAVLAIAENAIGARAYRPGDVLRTLSGRLVEVVDTDAEGRMVLADALHYARMQFRPRALLDIGTFTGAVVTALGRHRAGLFGTDRVLLARVAAAGDAVGEQVWPMPIPDRDCEHLRSEIADLRQCAPRGMPLPDAGHAAAFLREFAGTDIPWAHLDIAGVALRDEDDVLGPKGPSGFGARLLDALVERYYEL